MINCWGQLHMEIVYGINQRYPNVLTQVTITMNRFLLFCILIVIIPTQIILTYLIKNDDASGLSLHQIAINRWCEAMYMYIHKQKCLNSVVYCIHDVKFVDMTCFFDSCGSTVDVQITYSVFTFINTNVANI